MTKNKELVRKSRKHIKQLDNAMSKREDLLIVIIGYNDCPYSAMALETVQNSQLKDHCLFVGCERGSMRREFDQATGYSGTFPVIFMRENSDWSHIGGASELVSKVKTPSFEML